MRDLGHYGLVAPSAALKPGGRRLYFSGDTLTTRANTIRDGLVIVLFGHFPNLPGWRYVHTGQPRPDLLSRIQPLTH